MSGYDHNMTIGDRVKQLRKEHAMTQEDLMERSGLSLATVQRAERGLRLSADTIASLAAAFDLNPTDLTNPPLDRDDQPYLPLNEIQSGRQLLGLVAAGAALDFAFVELSDLKQAELVERLQTWCQPLGSERIPAGAVAQVKLELEATQLLREMAAADLVVNRRHFRRACL